MGQVALGFRNFFLKAAVFVVMAAALAWMLGGALWPRATVLSLDDVQFDGRAWFWQLTAGGRIPDRYDWQMMVREGEEPVSFFGPEATWDEVAGPVVTERMLAFGGRAAGTWTLYVVEAGGAREQHPCPDRLALELQFERIKHGLDPLGLEAIAAESRRLIEAMVAESEVPALDIDDSDGGS